MSNIDKQSRVVKFGFSDAPPTEAQAQAIRYVIEMAMSRDECEVLELHLRARNYDYFIVKAAQLQADVARANCLENAAAASSGSAASNNSSSAVAISASGPAVDATPQQKAAEQHPTPTRTQGGTPKSAKPRSPSSNSACKGTDIAFKVCGTPDCGKPDRHDGLCTGDDRPSRRSTKCGVEPVATKRQRPSELPDDSSTGFTRSILR